MAWISTLEMDVIMGLMTALAHRHREEYLPPLNGTENKPGSEKLQPTR